MSEWKRDEGSRVVVGDGMKDNGSFNVTSPGRPLLDPKLR